MAVPVNLTYHVSAALLTELTQNGSGNGVNAYLWYNSYSSAGASSPFTTIISNGVQTGGTTNPSTGTTDWDLPLTTDSVANPVSGGKVYLIIQSNPTSTPTINDLTTLIGTTEGNINPANAVAYNFSYDTFEVALANATGDVADLSAINSFGHQFGISAVVNGETLARGYNASYDAGGIGTLINDAAAAVPGAGTTQPVINFPAGSTLAALGMIAITPATDNGDQAPPYNPPPATPDYTSIWQPSDWQQYVTTVSGLTGIELVGHFNGAEDAAGVYHSAGYYDYTVAVQTISGNPNLTDGTYFVLSPSAESQIRGYLVIGETALMGNLYSPGLAASPAYVFSDAALQDPYNIDGTSATGEMNTGANNQWGNIFTQLFTGFTGGYYGGTGESIPTSESSPYPTTTTVNLNQSYNWDPTYAFDGARVSGTTLTGQHYDPYAKIFFDNSNIYGTAYGDALTANFNTSVTLPVFTGAVGTGSNVSNIDLWAFAATETMTMVPGTTTNFYAPYTIDNYLAPGGTDYAVPTGPSGGNSLSLTLANNGMVVDPDTADIQLGIYLGAGQFQYLSLPSGAAQNGGGPWQVWTITQDTTQPAGQQYAIESIAIPGNFSAVPPQAYIPYTSSEQIGSLSFDNLPAVAGATNWYQLIVGGKTFNFYATLDSSSNVTVVAADGLASVTQPTSSGQASISLSVVPGFMDALPGAVMESYSTPTTLATLPQPTAPVAGTLAGGVLTPLQTTAGQAVDTNASVYLAAATELGFGWTGLSTAVNKPSWISAVTNKVGAANLAFVNAVDLATGLSAQSWFVTPDIDGQWLTPTAYNFTDGAYAVTMTEMLADEITPYGNASSPVYVVVSATGVIADTAARISGALDAYQAVVGSLTSITITDGQPLTIDWADITADAAALALIPGGAYTLNVVDSSTTIMANIAALNGNAKVVGIGFTDAAPPTLTFTDTEYTTTYSTAIGEMMGARSIAVTGVAGQNYTSFTQNYTHGVQSSGASGTGILSLTQQFASNYTGGNITNAGTWEHDLDGMSRVVRDLYSGTASNGITVAETALPALYQTGGAEARDTFTSVEYDYANGVSAPMLSTFTFSNAGPAGSTGEIDVFDVNDNLISETLTGFNPDIHGGVVASETTYALINSVQTATSTTNFYQYSIPVNGNHYTLAQETLDSSGRALKQVFSGLFGVEGQLFSSYEHDFLGGVHSGSQYVTNALEGRPYTGIEISLDADNNISQFLFTGVTSQPYSSYAYDYSYENGAWGGGAVVGQTYFYTNVEGQSYQSYEANLDGAGAVTSYVYSGYTVTATQIYSSLEYFYSGGVATGAYTGYVTNIAGQGWTGEVHEFNTSGQLVSRLLTGVTDQTSTSYQYDFANGDGVLTGSTQYFTNVANQGYSSYQYGYTASQALALEVYNMNDGSHRIIGSGISQTIDSIYDDLTTGGGGTDIFNFTPFFGDATITDFTSGTDQIQLATSEFANFAYVQAHSSVSGGNTVIDGSNGDSITLQGITTLQESDFLFV
jgi:hypothetical protein